MKCSLMHLSALALCITFYASSAWADDTMKPSPADSTDFKSLFNGETLEGWDGDPRLWSVRDGAIYGETTPEEPSKGNTFIIWQGGKLKDFELRLSFKCNATNNSGVQYRSERLEKASNNWVVKGYQHEIRNEEIFPNVPSFIYDEKGKRKRICQVGEKAIWTEDGKKVLDDSLINQEEFKKLMRVDEWNNVVIIAKGNRIQHYLNGRLVLDFTDEHPELARSEGVLALQLHGGKPMWTSFKDIKLRVLN